MQSEEIISATEFCLHHNIEISFVYSLREYGLIETVIREEKIFIPVYALGSLERMMRLHYDLGINFEGIETIHHLIDRVKVMEKSIMLLTDRLKIYE